MKKNIQNNDLNISEYQIDSLARILLSIYREYLQYEKCGSKSEESNKNEKQ